MDEIANPYADALDQVRDLPPGVTSRQQVEEDLGTRANMWEAVRESLTEGTPVSTVRPGCAQCGGRSGASAESVDNSSTADEG